MQYSSRPVLVASAGSKPSGAGPPQLVRARQMERAVFTVWHRSRTGHARAHGQPLHRAANADDFAYNLQRQKRPRPRLGGPLGVPGAGQDLLRVHTAERNLAGRERTDGRPAALAKATNAPPAQRAMPPPPPHAPAPPWAPAAAAAASPSPSSAAGRSGAGACDDVIDTAPASARPVRPPPPPAARMHLFRAVA